MKRVVVPKFSSEAEEAAWWDANRSGVEAEIRRRMKQRKPLTLSTLPQRSEPSQPVTLRIRKEDLETARRLAARKGMGYQTYIKMLLREALAENAAGSTFKVQGRLAGRPCSEVRRGLRQGFQRDFFRRLTLDRTAFTGRLRKRLRGGDRA